MPYTKEQLRAYWAANKLILNQKRKDKRRLAKLGLAIVEPVSHLKVSQFSPREVSHLGVSQNSPGEVSQLNSEKISHYEVSQLTANPHLTKLTKAWKTQTNYACPPTCSHSYCANCWFFADQELIDYKAHSPLNKSQLN